MVTPIPFLAQRQPCLNNRVQARMQGSFQNSLTFQNVKIEEIKHSKRLWVSDVKPLFFAFFDITYMITLSIRSYIEHSRHCSIKQHKSQICVEHSFMHRNFNCFCGV